MSEPLLISRVDQTRLDSAQELFEDESRMLSRWVRKDGFKELITKMPGLHEVGFIAVDQFLTDKGVDDLTRDPEVFSGRSAPQIQELFHRLSHFGEPDSPVTSNTPWWDINVPDFVRIEKPFYCVRHQDSDASSHTFILNPVCGVPARFRRVTYPFSYSIWPDKWGEAKNVQITPHKLVVLDGYKEQTSGGYWKNTQHRVNLGDNTDKRLRIMYYEN